MSCVLLGRFDAVCAYLSSFSISFADKHARARPAHGCELMDALDVPHASPYTVCHTLPYTLYACPCRCHNNDKQLHYSKKDK